MIDVNYKARCNETVRITAVLSSKDLFILNFYRPQLFDVHQKVRGDIVKISAILCDFLQ
jgi:hypothetical protein